MKNEYTSSVSFFVDRAARRLNLPSGLGGLAQQLGLSDDETGQPLEFYAWLASSYGVLKAILVDTVPVGVRTTAPGGTSATTAWEQLFGKPYPLDSVAESRGIKRLRSDVRATVNPQTSLVTVTTTAPTGALAMWLASRTFAQVNQANTVTRQTRAGNELRFLQKHQEHGAEVLRLAEEALTAFYQKNRKFQDSPVLVFEEERLRRAVDVAREVYLSLTRSAQEAELRAVRDIPALTLIEGPVVPASRSKPRRLLLGITGALLGLALAYGHAWLSDLRGEAQDAA